VAAEGVALDTAVEDASAGAVVVPAADGTLKLLTLTILYMFFNLHLHGPVSYVEKLADPQTAP
jgi:hypothetical protein